MSANLSAIGVHKVKSVLSGQSVELKSLWQDQDTAIIFFRRWGCMFCRLWAKELGEISPILQKNNVKLIGVGVEEAGSKEFIDGKFFDGDLYYVEDLNTYQTLGFKRFNVLSILTSLFWKQSREAITKGRSMGLQSDLVGDGLQNGGALLVRRGVPKKFVQQGPADHMHNVDIVKFSDTSILDEKTCIKLYKLRNSCLGLGSDLKGDWVQTGGALLVGRGGTLKTHFVQTGPGEHLPNLDILKHFGLESEYKPETMANDQRGDKCSPVSK